MKIHDLKCWPVYFQSTVEGAKKFEDRQNDRNYHVGDLLWLREWEPKTQAYTGRTLMVRVDYILPDDPQIPVFGKAIMSITKVTLEVTEVKS